MIPLRRSLLLLCSILLPAISSGASLSLWPFLMYERQGERVSLEVLGPIFFYRRTGGETLWGVRPLLSRSTQGDYNRWEFLYPLGKYERRGKTYKAYLAPLWISRGEEGGKKNTAILTLYWGRTEGGESYGGLFPLWGGFRERFGRDRIEFRLWPLYTRIEDEGTTVEKFLWPFLQRFRGREEGFCLWPLYCRREEGEKLKKGYVFWPFYVWKDEAVPGGTLRMRLYFPLYASIRSPQERSDIYLPPFFFHKRRFSPPYERWETPWPFVIWDQYEEGIMPLYRRRKEPNKERRWVLWPLYVYEWDRMGDEEQRVYRFFLINRHRKVLRQGVLHAEDFNLWPLFSWRKGRDRGSTFSSLQPLPFHDEGLERNLYPLFWILRWELGPSGESFFDLLWGLFRYRRSKDGISWNLAFLLRGSRGEDFREICLLGGRLCLRREGGRNKIVLFSSR